MAGKTKKPTARKSATRAAAPQPAPASDIETIDELQAALNDWCHPVCWRTAFELWDDCRRAEKQASEYAADVRAGYWKKMPISVATERENVEILRRAALAVTERYLRVVRGLMRLAPTLVEKFPAVEFSNADEQRDVNKLAAAARGVAAILDAPKADDDLTLSDNEYIVLRAVLDADPRRVQLVTLETNTNITRKTCGQIVTSLVAMGLAHRTSERSGCGITDKGKTVMNRERAQITH